MKVYKHQEPHLFGWLKRSFLPCGAEGVTGGSGNRGVFLPKDCSQITERALRFGVRVCVKSLQSCLTLCDPVGCSPPGSSVHEILQARPLDWDPTSSPSQFGEAV